MGMGLSAALGRTLEHFCSLLIFLTLIKLVRCTLWRRHRPGCLWPQRTAGRCGRCGGFFFFGEWHIAEEAEDAGQGVGLEALAKLLSIPLVEGAGVLSLGSQTNMWMRARTSHL